MDYTIRMTDLAEESTRHAILDPLVTYNKAMSGRDDHRPLVVSITDSAGQAVGGLWGHTGYDWLFVSLLFVPEQLRGRGVGSDVLLRAEAEAISRGCHGVWLDTFQFQARGFYERLGYTCFAELADYPRGATRYFFRKALHAGTSAATVRASGPKESGMPHTELHTLRDKVDAIDVEVVELLAKRFEVTAHIGKLKARESLRSVDPDREARQFKTYEQLAVSKGLNPEVLANVFRVVIDEVVRRHRDA